MSTVFYSIRINNLHDILSRNPGFSAIFLPFWQGRHPVFPMIQSHQFTVDFMSEFKMAMMERQDFIHVPVALPSLYRIDTPNGRYYRTPGGKRFPSMTNVLGSIPKPELDEWRLRVGEEEAKKIMEEAARHGNFLHKMCENYLKNESFKNKDPKFNPYQSLFMQVRPHLNKVDNVRAIETSLCSYDLQIAGTVDLIAEYGKKLAIEDFKNTEKVKKPEWIEHYFMQAAGYSIMWEEMTGESIKDLIIIIGNRGDVRPQIFEERREKWEDKLKRVVEEFHRKNQI